MGWLTSTTYIQLAGAGSILSGSLSELPKTFTLGIKLKLRKIKTEKLEIIIVVVILKTC